MENSLLVLLIAITVGLALVKIIIEPLIRMLVGFLKTIIPFLIVVIIGFVALGTQQLLSEGKGSRKTPEERTYSRTDTEKSTRRLERESTNLPVERELNDILHFVDWEEETETEGSWSEDHLHYTDY